MKDTGNHLADPAETAEDEMSPQPGNSVFHSSPPQGSSKVAFDDIGYHAGYDVERSAHAADNQEDAEYPSAGAQGVDFSIADSGYGNDCHIEGVEKRPTFNDGITGNSNCRDSNKNAHSPK